MGMPDSLIEVLDEEHEFWEEVEERREATQRETRGKHKIVEEDVPFDEDKEQETPIAGLAAFLAPAPAQQKQKIKIKLKVTQEEKMDLPSEYEANEEEPPLKRKEDLVPPLPRKRQKERSHRVIDTQTELEKL